MAKEATAFAATESEVKKTRKPRDPSKPRVQRPAFLIAVIIDANGNEISGATVKVEAFSRNGADLLMAYDKARRAGRNVELVNLAHAD